MEHLKIGSSGLHGKLRCTVLGLPRKIFVLITYIACAQWLRVVEVVLLYMLKYRVNAAKDNIFDIVQEYHKRIK